MEVSMEKRMDSTFRAKVNDRVGIFLAEKTKIKPNSLTLIGVFSSIAAALIIVIVATLINIKWALFVGAFPVIVAAIADLLDGAVAKARRKTTKFGAFLDDNCDRLGEILVFGAILWLQANRIEFLAVFLAGTSSILVSYLKATAETRGFNVSSGKITGRPARIVLLIILMLVSPWVSISQTLWLVIALNIFTLVKRGLEVKKQGG